MSSLHAADLFDVKGKVAVVTGGGRGIGLMIATTLVQNGAKVYIASRKVKNLTKATESLNALGAGQCIALTADLETEEGCLRFISEISAREPKLHVLVNNSGVAWGASFEQYPAKAWKRLLAVNLEAIFYLTRGFMPLLEKAAKPNEPASVINISSIDGVKVTTTPAYAYSASKAAVNQMTRTLANELAKRHVNVNAILPGPFESRMLADLLVVHGEESLASEVPIGRSGNAGDIAGLTLLLSSRAGRYMTGALIPCDGGALVSTGGRQLLRHPESSDARRPTKSSISATRSAL